MKQDGRCDAVAAYKKMCVVDDGGKVAEGWEMLSFFLEGQTHGGARPEL